MFLILFFSLFLIGLQQPQQGRWRGASEIGAAPAELASKTSVSKRDREKAHRGTFSQLGNDSVAGGGLFAEDASAVTDARRKAKETSSRVASWQFVILIFFLTLCQQIETEEEEDSQEVGDEPVEEEEKAESPSFLAKLFGSAKKPAKVPVFLFVFSLRVFSSMFLTRRKLLLLPRVLFLRLAAKRRRKRVSLLAFSGRRQMMRR